jgi:sn-glycerol 3-phosphate transport system substrate-binding protein
MTAGLTRRAVLLAALLATGPAVAQNAAAPTTITFYSYNLASAGIGAAATRELLDAFMAENPAIKVEGVAVPSDQMTSRVQADIVAGRVPDVAQLVFSDLDFIVRNLGVKALRDIVPPEEWEKHTAGMVPAGLKLGEIDGKTYGLAFTFSTPVLFYNATVFRAAGLDPERPPRNWDEVKQAALAIKATTGKLGIYPSVYSGFDWLLQSLVLSNGGRVLSADRKRLMFGEAEAVAAIATMRDLVASGAQPNLNDADATDAMAGGNLGMLLTTSVYQRLLLNASKDKWELRAASMPGFGDRPTAPVNSGSALFILAGDGAKQRAAWQLMKFLTSKQGYTIITSKIGYLPLRLDIVDDPRYLGGWVEENPLVRPNLEQLTRLNQWQSFPGANYKQINKIEVTAVNEAVYGKGEVATVMREAQARAQALMPR